MATYYIADTFGNDSSGDGSQGNPYKTLGKVLAVVRNASADTIVEIMDESTYSEHTLDYRPGNPSSLIVRHTASHLGRPKFDATGAGSNGQFLTFDLSMGQQVTATFIGVEIETNNSADYFDGTFGDNLEFHISGCFLYGAVGLLGAYQRSARPVNTIKQSILFFHDDGAGGDMIQASDGLEISNCLLSSSAGRGVILKGADSFGSNNVTASFCTIISRRTSQQYPAVSRWGKLINCVVSSSGPGIAAADHSHNLVIGNESNNRGFAFTYGISQSNTWERKTIIIPGDTTGTWNKSNGVGLKVIFSLGIGSQFATSNVSTWETRETMGAVAGNYNLMVSTSNYIYFTGIQFEVGNIATTFEHRSINDELLRCKRYYYQEYRNGSTGGNGAGIFALGMTANSSNGSIYITMNHPVEMRAAPTVTFSGTFAAHRFGVSINQITAANMSGGSYHNSTTATTISGTNSGNAPGQGTLAFLEGVPGTMMFSAEY